MKSKPKNFKLQTIAVIIIAALAGCSVRLDTLPFCRYPPHLCWPSATPTAAWIGRLALSEAER